MILWRFKCLKCDYLFRQIGLKEHYEKITECLMCGSKEFAKKIVTENYKFVEEKE
jgi:DNA-directed RNA polymerase subunit RPC12/RpoP